MTAAALTVEDLQEAVRAHPRVLPRGAGTKPALSNPPDGVVSLDVRGLTGIVDYDPAELTFTARAGTPMREIELALSAHRQYLPFDPPWGHSTLGGVVAAGTSGPGSYGHGGVRDFVLGVRFLDADGRLVGGGGRVVKNAAGLDLPKLMVGSLGRLGVLVELSFKVFPEPEARTTVRCETANLDIALQQVRRLARGPIELDALDLEPPGTLWLRLSGPSRTLAPRAARLCGVLDGEVERLDGEDDERVWRRTREFGWAPARTAIAKVAVTSSLVGVLDVTLAAAGAARRYSRAATLAWVAWPAARPWAELDLLLSRNGLGGVTLTGPATGGLLGARTGGAFAQRIRHALDPNGRFPEL